MLRLMGFDDVLLALMYRISSLRDCPDSRSQDGRCHKNQNLCIYLLMPCAYPVRRLDSNRGLSWRGRAVHRHLGRKVFALARGNIASDAVGCQGVVVGRRHWGYGDPQDFHGPHPPDSQNQVDQMAPQRLLYEFGFDWRSSHSSTGLRGRHPNRCLHRLDSNGLVGRCPKPRKHERQSSSKA